MGLSDVKVPAEKKKLVEEAQKEVDSVWNNYMMGLITDNERYNQVIDIWTRTNTLLTNTLMKQLEEDPARFNSIYMMMHSEPVVHVSRSDSWVVCAD
jgi:DNA-directed RNA polymerase, beta'' subunit/160 kD subunit